LPICICRFRMVQYPYMPWQKPDRKTALEPKGISPSNIILTVEEREPAIICGGLVRWRILQCAMIAALLLTPVPACAESVRVIVDRALIWSSTGFVSIVLNQVPEGTVLEVLRRVDGWYEVVLPPGSSGPSGSVGYIRA